MNKILVVIVLSAVILSLAKVVTMFTIRPNSSETSFDQINIDYPKLLGRVSNESGNLAVATFAGGCFWCMEGPFEAMEGVEEAVVGFTGGQVAHPTYRQVVEGETGHRESVQVFYNPKQVTYQQLLETYWLQIDPTDPEGQFADRGFIYTTAIYYHNSEQLQLAQEAITELEKSGFYKKPIVTQILRFTNFYPAEDYHQDFYQKSSDYYRQYKKGSGREDYIRQMEKLWAR